MSNATFDRIARVLNAVLGIPAAQVTEATSQNTTDGWDSLNHIHLVAALESEFAISFSTDEALEMTSVSAMVHALRNHGISDLG